MCNLIKLKLSIELSKEELAKEAELSKYGTIR
jgi:hypothetical protein